MTVIGHNIKRYREERNLSQQDLARKIRVGSTTIDKYESGQQIPDTQTVLKISTVLDVPATKLLDATTAGWDKELIALVSEIGVDRAKLLLTRAKHWDDEQFLHVLEL